MFSLLIVIYLFIFVTTSELSHNEVLSPNYYERRSQTYDGRRREHYDGMEDDIRNLLDLGRLNRLFHNINHEKRRPTINANEHSQQHNNAISNDNYETKQLLRSLLKRLNPFFYAVGEHDQSRHIHLPPLHRRPSSRSSYSENPDHKEIDREARNKENVSNNTPPPQVVC